MDLAWIAHASGARSARVVERIQSLWRGYGELVRVELSGGPARSAIVKWARPPAGATADASFIRKCRSFDVEAAFDRDVAPRCDDRCRVARLLGARGSAEQGEWLLVLEDLDAAGFEHRVDEAPPRLLDAALAWLASFHARFLGEPFPSLWPIGTYWQLETRRDEIAAIDDAALRAAAPELAGRLATARFRTERVFVAQAFTDVTEAVRGGLDKIADPVARKEESEKRIKQQIAACEKDRPSVRCNVATYFRGGMYVLIDELEIRDVRLVYVPARSIGNYGGEVDNWRWPRHTGDFALYRAYVGKDGKPADHSADNVPYRPKHFLEVSDQGLRPSDFVMITGFPGRTNRTKTALEVKHDVEWYYPTYIELAKQRYAVAEAHLEATGETAIKAGVLKQRTQNGLEKITGVLKGLTSGDLLQRKAALDRQTKAWAAAPGRERHKAAIARLEQLIAEEQRTARADFDRSLAFGSSQLLGSALGLTRWADERTKSDAERKAGYQERDLRPALASHKQLTKQFDATLDRALLRLALVRALELPPAERAWLPVLLGAKRGQKLDAAFIDKTLDSWYRATTLADEKLRVDLLQKGTKGRIAASKDPFLRAAQRVWKIYKAEEKREDAQTGELMLVAPLYADAMREALGGLLASDANSTLRITYGTVKAFEPTESPFTTASQILGKDTGKDPFDAPKPLLAAVKAKQFGPYAGADGELPVNFLSDLDTTSGNSGSAVLDDKGRLVGLNFDSTIQGVASDVVFDGSTVRKIHVDVRYMLWVMDKVDGADHLIEEMGLQPRL